MALLLWECSHRRTLRTEIARAEGIESRLGGMLPHGREDAADRLRMFTALIVGG
jgi:hypothetical protein